MVFIPLIYEKKTPENILQIPNELGNNPNSRIMNEISILILTNLNGF